MPRKGRKRPDSFTVILVPHSEKPAFSVRIPFWPIYVAIGLSLVGLVSLGYFLADYRETGAQLAEIRRAAQMETIHQNQLSDTIDFERRQQENLKAVIYDQEERAAAAAYDRADEAARFAAEVTRLYEQIAELEIFKAEIRRMVGLEKVSSAPTLVPAGQLPSAIGPLEPLALARVAANTSSRGEDRSGSAQDVIEATAELLDRSVPQQMADLDALKKEVSDRVSKVEGRWTSPDQLSSELSLYDAAPRGYPVSGNQSARFGYDPRRIDLGAQPFHKGVDFTAPVGSAVRAPQDGVVTYAGWQGSYGLTLELRHTLGWSTLYAHLSSVPVKVGQQVKWGDVIGYVGLTGLTTGPHLHYEIHLNGTPLDPLKYVGR